MFFKKLNIILFLLIFTNSIFSQNDFYDTDSLREIRISFYDSNWDYLLDSLYIKGDNDRILASVTIDGNFYDSVGVRYKGFSSVSVDRVKNPFNIKLDYVIDGQNHQGFDKLKLANVFQDPSFVREVLSYEVCRKYMPSPKANYANVFINDTLWGLYTNVEAINKDFLVKNYKSKYNPFFKCNPKNIDIQVGGENSNLSQSHGTDSLDYFAYYDQKSNFGWSTLYNLIDTLNNYIDSIDNILNVNRTLWMHALNYAMVNFDSYIGYAQNYYLYYDNAKQWNPIIWDLNMSFGSFRLTDASQLYFNGFDINQAQNMDPLIHHNYISTSPRPLLKKLFENDRHRKMYIAHIRTIIEENFINQDYINRAQFLQNLIDQSVQNDTNKFYSYSDFTSNLNNQVILSTSICPGISQLMDTRSSYLSSYSGYSGEPYISNITTNYQNFVVGGDLWIKAEISNANFAQVQFRFGENERFKSLIMYDDGNHNDGIAGDGVYGCKISNCSNSIDYYVYADNDSAGIFSPKRASFEFYNLTIPIQKGDLVINELMSNNLSVVADKSGKYDDWIELYNKSTYPISTNGLYLSDTLLNLSKWKLPNHVINPDSYYIIWADEDEHQGGKHANFRLSNNGETLILANMDSTVIDSITFISQPNDMSYSRSPNGFGGFTVLTPTFSFSNDFASNVHENTKFSNFIAYPNPFTDKLFVNTKEKYSIRDIFGREVNLNNFNYHETSSWSKGVYFIHLNNKNKQVVKILKI